MVRLGILLAMFPDHLAPGSRVGPYLVQRELGAGAVGLVYRARLADGPDRPVAVKVLSPWLAIELGREKFEREVRACAGLLHENVVEIFDFGETEDGVLYYAMEYVDGFDLARLVTDHGRQPVGRCVYILTQVAAALDAAHQAGLVHRDIKPANIVLCGGRHGGRPDQVKLVDFGLVMPITEASVVTAEGPGLGAPRYVAPEMLDPHAPRVGPAADLYCFGLVGYLLLTGQHCFDAPTPDRILEMQLREPPPPFPAFVPAPVAGVLTRCLAKDPAERPASAAEVRDALAECSMPDWDDATAKAWWGGNDRASVPPPM